MFGSTGVAPKYRFKTFGVRHRDFVFAFARKDKHIIGHRGKALGGVLNNEFVH